MEMQCGYVKPCMTDLPREAWDLFVEQIRNTPRVDWEALKRESEEKEKADYEMMKNKGLAD